MWRFGDSCKDVRDDWYTGSIRWSVAHDYINAQVFLARDACYLHNYTSPTGKRGQYRDTLECHQSHEQQDEGGSLPWCGVPGAAFSGSVTLNKLYVVLAVQVGRAGVEYLEPENAAPGTPHHGKLPPSSCCSCDCWHSSVSRYCPCFPVGEV